MSGPRRLLMRIPTLRVNWGYVGLYFELASTEAVLGCHVTFVNCQTPVRPHIAPNSIEQFRDYADSMRPLRTLFFSRHRHRRARL